MKTHLVIGISIASLFIGSVSTTSYGRDITAAEIASFLGISSWETKVSLAPNSYSIDICPIQDGKIGTGLLQGQIDWSKDPDGRFTILTGQVDGNYKFSIASKAGGSLAVSTQAPLFQSVYSPSLPTSVSEGVYILFADLVNRDMNGAQDSPSTYKRGWVLKISKRG